MENYYLGLDVGTNSVGWACTDPSYKLLKYNREPAWGSHLFEEGELCADRRTFRSRRRMVERKKQRIRLLQEIFAKEIAKVDPNFFIRLQESFIYKEDGKNIFFDDKNYTDRDYFKQYPTIHHLIKELMDNKEPHDIRLVYLACSWLLTHRGHFLNNINVKNVDKVTDFSPVWDAFCSWFTENGYAEPFVNVDMKELKDTLKEKLKVTQKEKKLKELLTPSKEIAEDYPVDIKALIKLLSDGKTSTKVLFGMEKDMKIQFGMNEDTLAEVFANVGEYQSFLETVFAIYDWELLCDILHEKTISEAKIDVYKQHKEDLKLLKYFIQKYQPDKYDEMFRDAKADNYVAYSYHTDGLCEEDKQKIKKAKTKDFHDYVKKILENINVEENDKDLLEDALNRINDFLPKQKTTDNCVIPQQVYQVELRKVLENASNYLPFLKEVDKNGYSNAEKILSIFTFKIPYFVGVLNPNSPHAWIVKKQKGRIYPWSFNEMVDLDASENAFIKRMTNTCTYLDGEKALPKNSLTYQKFMVLNEINNLKVNGESISVELKQNIYHDLFEKKKKVTKKHIEKYLTDHGIEEILTGIDEIQSSLSSYLTFKRLLDNKALSEEDVDHILLRITCTNDATRLKKWLKRNFSLPEEDIIYISKIKASDFGRLSGMFLTGLKGVDKSTGEAFTILEAMWKTNNNLMELLSGRFSFAEEIEKKRADDYGDFKKPLHERLDDMYVSNPVKRSIYRTLDVVSDVERAFGSPQKIFIEMTRSDGEKGNRTVNRREQIITLYKKAEDTKELELELSSIPDSKLQRRQVYLYFLQFGICAYSREKIRFSDILNGSKAYDIEHIYPQSYVKDDSFSNMVLVKSEINSEKKDVYPLNLTIQEKMKDTWKYWKSIGAISKEKYMRLTRIVGFSKDEEIGFINRQLVETSQSTKALATILKEKFPNAEIVYVKARNVSDFRRELGFIKSRNVNDLHHAVDAYLNIVVGNVYQKTFEQARFKTHISVKTKAIFNEKKYTSYWNGEESLNLVKKTANKNNAHLTMFSYLRYSGQNGGFFDQNLLKKKEGLIPIKKGMDTSIYGGYRGATIMCFLPVGYEKKGKKNLFILPIELLFGEKVLNDIAFAKEYAKEKLGVEEVCFPFGLRPWKIGTCLSFDGFYAYISGKTNNSLSLKTFMPLSINADWQFYIKKIEEFIKKNGKDKNYVYDEKWDKVSKEQNEKLYDLFLEKVTDSIYQKRMNLPVTTLINGKDRFSKLSLLEQCESLIQILMLFNRSDSGGVNLKSIGGAERSGAMKISSDTLNWRKNYSDVRVINQSATGMWKSSSGNLLDYGDK